MKGVIGVISFMERESYHVCCPIRMVLKLNAVHIYPYATSDDPLASVLVVFCFSLSAVPSRTTPKLT